MSYISHEALQAAKQMDLLTYLQLNDPQNLVRLSGNTYCTKEHDSLKISNGKWHWFSRHIGGRSALDYLMKVKGFSLPDGVNSINGYIFQIPPPKPQEKKLLLSPNNNLRKPLNKSSAAEQRISSEQTTNHPSVAPPLRIKTASLGFDSVG